MNKKHQLKPSLIMCVILAAVVLFVFAMATRVNKNVVKDYEGTILFVRQGKDNENGLMLYDFGTKELAIVSAAGNTGFFPDKDTVVYAEEGVLYKYDINQKSSSVYCDTGLDSIIKVGFYEDNGTILVLGKTGADYVIESTDKKEIYRTQKEITDFCGKYFTVADGEKSEVYEFFVSGSTPVSKADFEGRIESVSVTGNAAIFCLDGRAVTKDLKFSRDGILRFSTSEYYVSRVVPVSDTQFLVTAKKDNGTDMYMCNGSNMVRIDELSSDGSDEIIVACTKRFD